MKTINLLIGILLLQVTFCYGQIMYSGTNETITRAVGDANQIISNPQFISKIEAIGSFDNTHYSGSQIVQEMKNIKNVQLIEYYKKHTRANATTGKVISINTAKLDRPLPSIINTIIHEYIHSVDLLTNNKWDYTHKKQKEENPPISAPWVIGKLSEDYVN